MLRISRWIEELQLPTANGVIPHGPHRGLWRHSSNFPFHSPSTALQPPKAASLNSPEASVAGRTAALRPAAARTSTPQTCAPFSEEPRGRPRAPRERSRQGGCTNERWRAHQKGGKGTAVMQSQPAAVSRFNSPVPMRRMSRRSTPPAFSSLRGYGGGARMRRMLGPPDFFRRM